MMTPEVKDTNANNQVRTHTGQEVLLKPINFSDPEFEQMLERARMELANSGPLSNMRKLFEF